MNIYLDIDGTCIYDNDARAWDSASGLEEFVKALRPYDVYWLTTYCMDGDPTRARMILKAHLPQELHEDIDRIKPTTWHRLKTEAIDFSKEFIWFDNNPSREDREVLKQHVTSARQWLIEVHLDENPNRLQDIAREVLTTRC